MSKALESLRAKYERIFRNEFSYGEVLDAIEVDVPLLLAIVEKLERQINVYDSRRIGPETFTALRALYGDDGS